MARITICLDCGQEKLHKARGLCAYCYNLRNQSGNWTDRPLNIKRGLIICKICKQESLHLAHGMCLKCYNRLYREKSRGICKNCSKIKLLKARGLCDACYNHWYEKRYPKFCVDCGQHISRNTGVIRCHPCSMKGRSNPNWKGGKPSCIDCGKIISYGHIYCSSCAVKGDRNPNWKDGLGWLRARLRADLRNKLRNSPHALTSRQAKEILAIGHCFYCEKEMPRQKLELDHFVPVKVGGLTTRGNITIACKPCNITKWDRDPAEILIQLTFLSPKVG